MWILITAALATDEADCNGVDDDFDGQIDEGASCDPDGSWGCTQLIGADGSSFLVCDNGTLLDQPFAESGCLAYGYRLAAPVDATENALLVDAMATGVSYWLGLTFDTTQGVWRDPYGAEAPFLDWDTGFMPPQPDGSTGADCMYAYTGASLPYLWHDIVCSDATEVEGYACEARCTPVSYWSDHDGDGYGSGPALEACDEIPTGAATQGGDCDDTSADVNPGVHFDACNGVDDDCDEDTDEDEPPPQWFEDFDGDDFGNPDAPQTSCAQPAGFVLDDTDCDDADSGAFPGATEVCDGDLEDCTGTVDAGVNNVYYRDEDGDGRGDPSSTVDACSQPAGYVSTADDCDDDEPLAWTGAAEVCDGVDNDCNGQTDDGVLSTYWEDADADGFGDSSLPTAACTAPAGTADNPDDCDDSRGEAYPQAPEICNGLDDDCDSVIDNGTDDVQWYLDDDGDGYGDAIGAFQCDQPVGQVSLTGDCDDTDAHINPAADEVCDSIDHDCDGDIWNGLTINTFYPDVDQDGFGAGASVDTCEATQPGYVTNDEDCDDGEQFVNPDADEICDGIDNDCDDLTDDADDSILGQTVWYTDLDGDGYGVELDPTSACIQPADTTDRHGDCDDTEPSVYEGAPEACADGLDNDCDHLVDDEDPDFVNGGVAYAQDADNDNYGNPLVSGLHCSGEQPLGWVPLQDGEDCDDANSLRSPGLAEVCDGIDNDCNMQIDDTLSFLDYFLDQDGDGYGNPNLSTTNSCAPVPGRTSNGADCDDTDELVNPGATEICNADDDNCNNQVDEGLPTEDYYPDLDGDGFGDQQAEVESSCAQPSGKVADNTDCDDTDGHVFPGAAEDPDDGIDSDCDGTFEEMPPEQLPDSDGDGVPDIIDLVEPSDTQPPSPSPKTYGCGCTQSSAKRSWMLWWRRR